MEIRKKVKALICDMNISWNNTLSLLQEGTEHHAMKAYCGVEV
jgi:hypothetical protein